MGDYKGILKNACQTLPTAKNALDAYVIFEKNYLGWIVGGGT